METHQKKEMIRKLKIEAVKEMNFERAKMMRLWEKELEILKT